MRLKPGTTSKVKRLFIYNSTDGSALTGVAHGDITAYYIREGGAAVEVSLSAGTIGTWSSGGFVEITSANMPGIYEFGIPDAALASGADSVVIQLKGATNMAPVNIEIDMNVDPNIASILSKVQGATIEVVSPVKSNNGETDIELQYGQEYDDDGNAPTLYGDVTWSIPVATEDLTNATGGNLYIYGPDSTPVATITDITYPNAGTSSQQAKATLTAANTQLETETQHTYELWATFASGDPAKIAFGAANTLSKVPGN